MLFRFLNLREKDDDECHHKNTEGNHQCRCSICDFGFRHITNECSHQDIDCHGGRTVKYTSDLDELVSFIATTAKDVEHRVYHSVQHAHAKTGDERTCKVNTKSHIDGFGLSAQPLNEDTDNSYKQGDESCLFVADFFQ